MIFSNLAVTWPTFTSASLCLMRWETLPSPYFIYAAGQTKLLGCCTKAECDWVLTHSKTAWRKEGLVEPKIINIYIFILCKYLRNLDVEIQQFIGYFAFWNQKVWWFKAGAYWAPFSTHTCSCHSGLSLNTFQKWLGPPKQRLAAFLLALCSSLLLPATGMQPTDWATEHEDSPKEQLCLFRYSAAITQIES